MIRTLGLGKKLMANAMNQPGFITNIAEERVEHLLEVARQLGIKATIMPAYNVYDQLMPGYRAFCVEWGQGQDLTEFWERV